MNLSTTEIYTFLPILTVLGFWIAWNDLKTMLITNKTFLATVAIFAIVGPLVMPFETYLWRFAISGGILVITFTLFAFGAFGGGDAKIFPALGLFVAYTDWVDFMIILVAAMIAAVVLVIILRLTPLQKYTPDWKTWNAGRFIPMGLALGSSIIFYYALALNTL